MERNELGKMERWGEGVLEQQKQSAYYIVLYLVYYVAHTRINKHYYIPILL